MILLKLFKFLFRIGGVLTNISAPLEWAIGSMATMFSKVIEKQPPLDILASLIMLGQVNRKVPKKPIDAPQPTEGWQKGYYDRDTKEVEKVNRYVDYAMAMYNYPTYMIFGWIMRPITFIWALFYIRRPFNFFRYSKFHMQVVGDGFLYKKTAAFLASTPSGTGLGNLKFSSFVNGLYQTPFCIVVDEVTKAIVVAIRGTNSLGDVLTDGNITVEGFPEELDGKELLRIPANEKSKASVAGPSTSTSGSGEKTEKAGKTDDKKPSDKKDDGKKYSGVGLLDIALHGERQKLVEVHMGMYLCAMRMFGDVETQLISLLTETSDYKGYDIVVTGHSLGAGVASLLTLMLRKNWGKDKVRGYCFSPPGCMISEAGVEEARKCILSVFVGDDVVPRLSIHSMKDVRQDAVWLMNQGVGKIKFPVILKFLTDIFTWPVLGPLSWIASWPESVVIGLWKKLFGIDFRMTYQICGPIPVPADLKEDHDDHSVRLYTPGQILHLTEDGSTIKQEWTSRMNLQEIVVGYHMIADHMAKRVQRIVKRKPHWFSNIPVLGRNGPLRRFIEFWY